MKVLRIKLTQNQASYTRSESVSNHMTYPLPPYSTIIGALHNICGYDFYHEMDVSVQGKYGSMQREVYMSHGLLNNLEDDRGILVWLKNSNSLNGSYLNVAKALKKQSSFKNRITIAVYDEEKMEEYISIKEATMEFERIKKESIDVEDKKWKAEKNVLKSKLKELSNSSEEYLNLKEKIKIGNDAIKEMKEEFKRRKYEQIDEPISHFRTLVISPQYQEVLYDVELVIHIKASEEVLNDIILNQNNFVSLGRSEDFIELIEMKMIELSEEVDEYHNMRAGYGIYVNLDEVGMELFSDESYLLKENTKTNSAEGTVYYIPKDYKIEGEKRVFNKIPCLYSSNILIDADSENALFDADGGYIVNLN